MSMKHTLHILQVVLALGVVFTKKPCYFMKLLDYSTTETPHYLFHMELHENQTISSVSRVLKDVPIPVWHLLIVQHTTAVVGGGGDGNNSGSGKSKQKTNPLLPPVEPKVLYNGTYKTCEFWKYMQRVRVFNNVVQLIFAKDSTNMSLSCPLAVGTYVMRNIHVPPDTGLLKFMYWPNTIYTLFGTVYSQRSDKSLVKKCSYAINGTVLKMC